MPIISPFSGSPIEQKEFAKLDYFVMSHAFACQNELRRLCNERIYQNDLAHRLQAAGLTVQTEVPLLVTCRDFRKIFTIDLVVDQVGIYELKTAMGLIGEHEAQLLNYLFLHGARHGKLINFRPAQVEARFINATMTHHERRQFEIQTQRWEEHDQTDSALRENLLALLEDWGCGLDVTLYTEALVHFAGRETQVVQSLPLVRGKVSLGEQRFYLLNPEAAFKITALSDGATEYERQLRCLLELSPLRTLHWINLARREVQLVSLAK
jgi:GxxExxY protein